MNARHIFIAASCLALNLTLAKVAALLALPVYLDSIGTILAATLLPPILAIAVGVLTSLLGGVFINPYFAAYAGTQLFIALAAVAFVKIGFFERWWKAVIAGFGIAATAVIVSAPVTVLLFGGVTLSGTTAINAILLASGRTLWQSVIGGSVVIESIDKPCAALLSWLVLQRLPRRLMGREIDKK